MKVCVCLQQVCDKVLSMCLGSGTDLVASLLPCWKAIHAALTILSLTEFIMAMMNQYVTIFQSCSRAARKVRALFQ
jgi:hypothetical protein